MNDGIRIDPSLLTEVRRYGDFDATGCYNCGSCTIRCSLSREEPAFPRRSMRYVILGLREKLRSSLEPWLCYYCGDCSTACPREAEPGESMMTLRRWLISQYDWTGLSAKLYTSTLWRTGAHVAVGAAVLILAFLYHIYIVGLGLQAFVSLPMGMEHMFELMNVFTRSVYLITFLFLISSAYRMYRLAIGRNTAVKIPIHYYLTEARTLIVHSLTQIRFRDCTEDSKWIRHLLLAFGFSVMFVVTFFFLKWFQTDNIYPLYHPQRWLGYAATGALLYAAGDILIGRLRKRRQIHRFSDTADWIFPVSLMLIAVTGIGVHILRYIGLPFAALYTYAVHLAVVVPMVMIELPFGKGSHIIYRPLAIYFQNVLDRAQQLRVPQEDIPIRVEEISSVAVEA